MQNRLPVVLSTTALLVAVFGATPLGHAASRAIHAVPPFAKTASFAKFAGNASKLNGRKSTLTGAPGTIPVVGQNGKLPTAIGTVGLQGPKGDTGAKGDKGSPGSSGSPGISDYEIVTVSSATDSTDNKSITIPCPAGKKALGGGAIFNLFGPEWVQSRPDPDGASWHATAGEITPHTGVWTLIGYAICANVVS